MIKLSRFFSLIALISISWTIKKETYITVAADGSGDFTTIQAAINSLNTPHNVTVDSTIKHLIFIKRGTYNERVFIEKNNIILRGSSETDVKII